MERSYSWILLLGLSIVNISAIVDQIPASVRTGKENFALAAACISLIFSFLYTMANLNVGLAGAFVGNIYENISSAIVLAFWIVAISFIQAPANAIATVISDGTEVIVSANLYLFSWMAFLSAVYTAGVSWRDNLRFGKKFNQWVLLFTASVILMSTSINLKSDICDQGSDITCTRAQYAIAVGAIGVGLSGLAVIFSIFDYLGYIFELIFTFLSSILYLFGVMFLTSSSGPASSMGNMYFSVWGGAFVSFKMLIGVILPKQRNQSNDPNDGVVVDEQEDF